MTRLAVALSSILAIPLAAQDVRIDWFTLDGGGGHSTGGLYTVSSTIGQPDAGTLASGHYVIAGGFWFGSFTPPASRLVIARSGTNVLLSWSPDTPGYLLQTSDTLVAPNWTNAPSGGTNPATMPIGPGNRYYRLIRR